MTAANHAAILRAAADDLAGTIAGERIGAALRMAAARLDELERERDEAVAQVAVCVDGLKELAPWETAPQRADMERLFMRVHKIIDNLPARATALADIVQAARKYGRASKAVPQAMLDGVMSDARAALEASEALGYVRVPPTHMVVPIDPTDDMVTAAAKTPQIITIDGVLSLYQVRTASFGSLKLGDTASTYAIADAYRAMIAAAPAPPKGAVA